MAYRRVDTTLQYHLSSLLRFLVCYWGRYTSLFFWEVSFAWHSVSPRRQTTFELHVLIIEHVVFKHRQFNLILGKRGLTHLNLLETTVPRAPFLDQTNPNRYNYSLLQSTLQIQKQAWRLQQQFGGDQSRDPTLTSRRRPLTAAATPLLRMSTKHLDAFQGLPCKKPLSCHLEFLLASILQIAPLDFIDTPSRDTLWELHAKKLVWMEEKIL